VPHTERLLTVQVESLALGTTLQVVIIERVEVGFREKLVSPRRTANNVRESNNGRENNNVRDNRCPGHPKKVPGQNLGYHNLGVSKKIPLQTRGNYGRFTSLPYRWTIYLRGSSKGHCPINSAGTSRVITRAASQERMRLRINVNRHEKCCLEWDNFREREMIP
jgi:hypothetical protein